MKNINLLLILMLLAGGFYSCTTTNENTFEVPVTKYCSFAIYPGNEQESRVYIVNNIKELEKIFDEFEKLVCMDDVNYQAIDFSRHTLLIAKGSTSCCNSFSHEAVLFRNGRNQYTLEVSYKLGIAASADQWTIAVLTAKIANNARIILNVNELEPYF